MSNGNGQAAVLEHEIQQHSVTRAELEAQKPGENGAVRFYIGSYSGGFSTVMNTLVDLPAFWSFIRDRILVSTVTVESRWAQAVGIAVAKIVTREWDVSGEVPATRLDKARNRVKSLLMPAQRSPLVTDFLLRDNGAWAEIVRPTSQPTGVLGLNYLDSGRCMPTGDPRIPCIYWDRLGRPHELRDYQVMRFVDMPDGSSVFGTGMCAARRAYNDIRQTAATQRFRLEKITGNNPKSIYFVSGVSPKQIKDMQLDHQQKQAADNIVAFGGVLIGAFIQREGIEMVEIPIAALPDGFDYKTEMQGTAMAYANALPGVTYLDLMPMTGQRAGSSAQSQVVDDQSIQKDTFGANLVANLNESDLYKIQPEGVMFYMKGNDLADRKRLADIVLAFSTAAGVLVSKCGFEPQVIQEWLIDNEILQPDNTSEQFSVLGGEQPTGQVQQKPLKQLAPPSATATPTPDATATKSVSDVLVPLADAIRALAMSGERIGEKQLQPIFNVLLPQQEARGVPVVNVTHISPTPIVNVTTENHLPALTPPPINVHNVLPEMSPTFNVQAPHVNVTNEVASLPAQVTVLPAPAGDVTETIDVTKRDTNGLVQQFVKRITRRT